MEMKIYIYFAIITFLNLNSNAKNIMKTDSYFHRENDTHDEYLARKVFLKGSQSAVAVTDECKCANGYCEKDEKGKLICKCPPEWTAVTSSKCQKCDCGDGANCTFELNWWLKTIKKCICREGFSDNEGTCKADCSGQPCRNGGKCKVAGKDIACDCVAPYIGDFCEKKLGPIGKCENGGTCSEDGKCSCPPLTTGERCETVDCSATAPGCQSTGGNCIYDTEKEISHCDCADGKYYIASKKACEELCPTGKCKNGGTCSKDGKCSCPPMTTGERCEIVDCRTTAPGCQWTGGNCIYDTEEETSHCDCGDGKHYELQNKACEELCPTGKCRNGGTCSEDGKCSCPPLTTGERCETVDCSTTAPGCQWAGGNCIYDTEQKTSHCDCGDGKRYNVRIKACEEDKCKITCGEKEDVTCSGDPFGEADVTCTCRNKTMEFVPSDKSCRVNKCKEKCGNATDVECHGKRYEGDVSCHCEEDTKIFIADNKTCINPCTPNPCKNEGKCSVENEERICECKSWHTGKDCEIVNKCKEKCGSATNVECHGNPYEGNVSCHCEEDTKIFIADNKTCINPCTPNPCENEGKCSVEDGKRICECKSSYTGKDCEIDINECEKTFACPNTTYCLNTYGGYSCLCKDGFQKKRPDSDPKEDGCQDPCYPNPCRNRGICVMDYGKMICVCQDQFFGEKCEKDLCIPNPCENGGTCGILNGNMTCFCRGSFTGNYCEGGVSNWHKLSTSAKFNTTLSRTFPTSTATSRREDDISFTNRANRTTTIASTVIPDLCSQHQCRNGGICRVVANRPRCLCFSPFNGEFCEKDPCTSSPCVNDGTCMIQNTTFHCNCKKPFTGDFCERGAAKTSYILLLAILSLLIFTFIVHMSCLVFSRCMSKG